MSEWKECKLGDFADITMGQSPKSENYNDFGEGLPFLQGNRTFGSRYPLIDTYCTDPKKIANEGEILFSVRAPVADINIANRKICIGRGLASFNAKNQQNLFLFYLLHFIKGDIINSESGTVYGSVNKKDLESVSILLPPLPEQKAIASVLSSLDDKIDLLHRENKTLEAIAGILFRQWFVEEASDDWEEILLNDIYMFDKGFEPGSRNYLENKEADSIRFIRVGDMLDLKASTYIKKEPGQITCGKKDLLVSFDGTIGRVSFGLEGAYSSGIRKVYSLNPVYNSLGLKYLLFTSREIQDVIKSHSSGTVIAHAGSSIDYLTFRFPKKNRLQEFNQITDPMFFKITKNLDQIETLEKLRNNLLPKLISGEVRVKI